MALDRLAAPPMCPKGPWSSWYKMHQAALKSSIPLLSSPIGFLSWRSLLGSDQQNTPAPNYSITHIEDAQERPKAAGRVRRKEESEGRRGGKEGGGNTDPSVWMMQLCTSRRRRVGSNGALPRPGGCKVLTSLDLAKEASVDNLASLELKEASWRKWISNANKS